MSKTVDERVVSMQFDNKNFESNVQTSLSTLDKLKRSLNMDGASKGLEKVNTAAKNVNMSGLSGAVETVHAKFSALEVVGVTALANITNSAVNAGKRIISSLTIEPVKTGFQEYELKMDSVRTIMASTGESVDIVNKYLEELNKYSDQTIYSFSDMTQNIGKFTNAGVKLEDAVLAIKGISNEAAVSGANANEASRAMYNFAQALSAGHVKLIDWKSIENANMATKEFKEQLIQTAVELGTVVKVGDKYKSTTTDANGKVSELFTSTSMFNDSLSAQWMTTDVLVKTLGNYADSTTKIGKKAYAAAQDVTKFTQMMDVLKETAQSGWARTWELLFGDINKAKAIFTPLTNFLSDIIDKISDFRNNLLEGALASPFVELSKRIEKVTSTTSKAIDKVKDLGDVVDRVIRGDFGNQGDNGDANYRAKKLAAAGYDYATVQNKVNEKLGVSFRLATKASEAQKDLSKSQAKSTEEILKMSDAQLKRLGFTEKEIQAFKELKEYSEKTGIPIKEILKDTDKLSGRTLLINSFKNAGQGLVAVITAIKDAWVEVFPPMTSDQLYNIIAGLHKFSLKLKVSDETADKLKRTLKGVFAIIDVILTVVSGPFKIAFKILTQILGMFDLNILDVTAAIGDAIVGFRDWIDSTLDFTKAFEKIIPYVKDAAKAISDWFSGIKEADNIPKYIIDGLVNGLVNGASAVWTAIIYIGETLVEKIKNVLGIHSPSTEFIEIGKNIIAGLVEGIQNGASKVWEAIKNIAKTCIDVISKIDFKAVFAAGLSVGLLWVTKQIIDVADKFADAAAGVGRFMSGAGKLLSDIGDRINPKKSKFEVIARSILELAIAIGILAASVYVLAQLDAGKLWGAIGALAALAAIVGVLAFAASKIDTGNGGFGKLSLALVGITASLYIMASAIKKLSFLNSDNVGPILGGLVAMVAGLSTLLIVFGKFVKGKSAQNIDKAGKTLLKISIVMLLLVHVIKQISKLDNGALLKGGIVITAFGGIMVGLIAATKLAGKNADKIGSTLLKISASMALMVLVIKMISKMESGDIAKGLICMTLFAGIITGLIAATKLAGNNAPKIGGTLLAISGAIFVMSLTVKILSTMDVGALAKGITCVTLLSGIIVGLVAAVKMVGNQAPKIALTILAMSVAIGILAGVSIMLSWMDLKGLSKGIAAVGMLGIILSLMIKSTKGADNCKGNIIAMTVAIGVMAVAVAALSLIDGSKLAGATVALSMIMGMFALMTKAAGSAQKSIGTIIILTIAVVALAGVLYALSLLDSDKALKSAASLSLLLVSMSISLGILSKVGGSIKNALLGVVGLLAMAVPLLAFVGILALMQNIQNATNNVIALTVLATAMSLLLIPLSLVGMLIGASGGVALLGVVGLLAMAVPLLAFVGILALMQGIQNATANVMLLIALTEVLSNVLVKLAIVGPLALIGVTALSALTILMVAIGALAIGIGALMEKFPALESFLDTGIPIMIKLADGVGRMIGAFVGGIIESLAATLPTLGLCLSQFMINAMPFISGIKMVDDSVLKGVGILAASVIALTVADLIAGIASFLQGGTSFASLGTELSMFMTNAMPFILGVSMLTPEMTQGVKNLSEAILILTAADIVNGIASFFGGGSSLSDFGAQLAPFGESIAKFSEAVSGKIDPESVTAAANAGKTMAEMASKLPNSGGLFGAIFGENDMGDFAKQLISFGEAIVGFSDKVKGNVDEKAVQSAANAGKIMTEFADTIPNSGPSVVSFFVGDNDIATFGTKLVSFGMSIVAFSNTVKGNVDESAVKAAANAGSMMVKMSETIPKTGGLVSFFTGDNDLSTFGTKIASFGSSIVSFSSTVKGNIDEDAVKAAANAGKIMTALANNIPKSGGIASLWNGDNGLDSFGEKLVKFGKKMKEYSEKVSGINTSAMSSSTSEFKKLIDMAKGISEVNFDGLGSFGDSLGKLGKTGVDKFIKAFDDSSSKVSEASKSLVSDSITAIRDKYQEFYTAGSYLVTGFCNGISENDYKAAAKAAAMAKAAKKAAEDALGIESPSKVFYGIGKYTGQGFVNALDDYSSIAYDSASNVGYSAKNGLSWAISKIGDIINGDIDVQPTIRPVMDLSDVKSGANTIGGMLSGRRTLSVDTRSIGIISNSMSKIQNGDRSDDIISSIENLRKDISDNPRNVYTINGLTYDDGSNISDAVKSIVRAARIERRT